MSVASVTTVSNVAGWPATAECSVSAPSMGESAPGVAVIRKKVSQLAASLKPAQPSAPIGSSGLPSKQMYAFASESCQVVGHLTALQQHVHRHHDRTGLQDRVVDGRELRQVRAARRDLVTGPDAAAHQQVRHLVGHAVEGLVVHAHVAEHDRVAVGVAAGAVLEKSGEVEHEQAPGRAEPHPPPDPGRHHEGGDQADGDDRDERQAERGDRAERDGEAEQDDADAQELLGDAGQRRDARPGQDPDVGGEDAQADGPGEHADRGHEPVTQEGPTEAERQDGEDEGAAAPRRSTAPRAPRWSGGPR